MTGMDRRLAVQQAAGWGLFAGLSGSAVAVVPQEAERPSNPAALADESDSQSGDAIENRDRECVLAAGMTPEEADCWKLAAELAGKFFALPELHPSDQPDIANAIHVVQHRLLSRPTYRAYHEAHKTLGTDAPQP
jgi:hypothetical protein